MGRFWKKKKSAKATKVFACYKPGEVQRTIRTNYNHKVAQSASPNWGATFKLTLQENMIHS
jgi:hypothetical protein